MLMVNIKDAEHLQQQRTLMQTGSFKASIDLLKIIKL